MLARVAAAGAVREGHVANTMQQVAMVDDPVADDVDHLAFLLHTPFQPDHGGRHHGATLRLEAVGPKYAVGDAGLVLDRYEQHTLRGTGLLAHQDDARDFDMAAADVEGALSLLGELRTFDIDPDPPDISRSLNLLREQRNETR